MTFVSRSDPPANMATQTEGLAGAVDTLGGRFPDRDDLRTQVVGNDQSDLVTIHS
jgi:hypothetical protein